MATYPLVLFVTFLTCRLTACFARIRIQDKWRNLNMEARERESAMGETDDDPDFTVRHNLTACYLIRATVQPTLQPTLL